MKWLTLDTIKQHLRIDHDCEDGLLATYGESCEEVVLNICNRTYDDFIEKYGEIPAPVYQATLILVDVSYQYRSPDSPTVLSQVPYTFDILIKPYMIL